MTELLSRPHRRPAEVAPADPSGIWWRGTLAAVWAVAVGLATVLVIVLVAWAADSRAGSSAPDAMRSALQIWLVSHRVPLRVDGGSIAVAPLLLTLALAFLVARAAAVLARGHDLHEPRSVGLVALAVGMPYAVLTTFVAAAAESAEVHPSPVAALLGGALLGTTAAAWGAARGVGLVSRLWSLVPDGVRVPLGAGAAAAGVLFAGSSLLVLAALALHAGEAADAVGVLGGGAVAGVTVVALDVVLLPNAAVCALGYLTGPGFAIGSGTSITVNGVTTGALPALPLTAAVPAGPAPALTLVFGIAMLVVAGGVAAWLVARTDQPLLPTMGCAAAAGASAGMVAAVAATLAGGPAGPGRMSTFGVSPWQVGLVVAAEVAVVACAAAGTITWRRGR
jgi:hypothetical protein